MTKQSIIIKKGKSALRSEFKIWPWKPGDSGILCMPMQKYIPSPSSEDWKLVECPKCGNGCWESYAHRELLKNDPEMKAACTECALRAGIKRT
jgi:hypothetical protein